LYYEEQLVIYRGEVRKTGFWFQQLTHYFFRIKEQVESQQDDLVVLVNSLGSSPQEVDFQLKLNRYSLLYQAF